VASRWHGIKSLAVNRQAMRQSPLKRAPGARLREPRSWGFALSPGRSRPGFRFPASLWCGRMHSEPRDLRRKRPTMPPTFVLIPGRTARQGTTLNEGKFTEGYVEETSTLLVCPDDM